MKRLWPQLYACDILPYPDIDIVFDGRLWPFGDETVSFVAMLNTFHHVPDVDHLLTEACRCLVPGGRLLIADQNHGFISSLVLRYLHHEPYRPDAPDWKFESSGPLSGANGALAWIVFHRDRGVFEKKYPRLRILACVYHTPLLYWLSGGLKAWSLVPGPMVGVVTWVEKVLLKNNASYGELHERRTAQTVSERVCV